MSASPASLAARRLRDMLRGEILSGAFQGVPLPSEGELMRGYGASRGVVRKALGLLRDEELVRRLQGQGTFAVSPAVITRLVEAHGVAAPGPSGALGGRARPDILNWSRMRTPDSVRRLLGPEAEECLCIEYVAYLDGRPMALATNYVAYPEADGMQPTLFHSDWYQLLTASGVTVFSSQFVIGCEAADRTLAALLGVNAGHPLLTMDQIISDSDGRIFNVAYIHSRGDRFAILSIAAVQGGPAEMDAPDRRLPELPPIPVGAWSRDVVRLERVPRGEG